MAATLTQPTYTPRLIAYWQLPDREATTRQTDRHALLVPGDAKRVTLAYTGEQLPWIGGTLDHLRHPWHKFELPAIDPPPAGEGDKPRRPEVTLRIHFADGSRQRWTETLPLDRRSAEALNQEQRALTRLADRQRSLIDALEQRQQQRAGVFRAGANGEGLAVPLNDLAPLWPEHAGQRVIQHELVRAWAPRLERAIKQICHAPRTALMRDRRIVSAGRIRELDAQCVRWLARQPGHTPAEKAGPRQRLMGITRYEKLDTLENRTAAMVIRAIEAEGHRVLASDPGAGEANAPVERLLNVIERWRRASPVPGLPGPGRVVKPTHVLQSDPRYRTLWQTHLALQHRDQRRAAAWRWRHRLWAERCLLAIMCRLQTCHPHSPAGRTCAVFRRHDWRGRWLDPTTALGRWELGSAERPASVMLIERRDLDQFRASPIMPEPLIAMSPDAVLIHRPAGYRDEREAMVVGLWCEWAQPRTGDGDTLQARCEATAHQLTQINTRGELRGLVLEPRLSEGDAPATPIAGQAEPRGRLPHGQGGVPGMCRGIKLPLPLTDGIETLDRTLHQLLDLTDGNDQ